MLEEYSPDDIFDMMCTAAYDCEQDFTFEFEDGDEFLAFVDSNSERLDTYHYGYMELHATDLITLPANKKLCHQN